MILRQEKKDFWHDLLRTLLIGAPIAFTVGWLLIHQMGLVDQAKQEKEIHETH